MARKGLLRSGRLTTRQRAPPHLLDERVKLGTQGGTQFESTCVKDNDLLTNRTITRARHKALPRKTVPERKLVSSR